jgi:hypothetical protein
MPKHKDIRHILVIGSGAAVIVWGSESTLLWRQR